MRSPNSKQPLPPCRHVSLARHAPSLNTSLSLMEDSGWHHHAHFPFPLLALENSQQNHGSPYIIKIEEQPWLGMWWVRCEGWGPGIHLSPPGSPIVMTATSRMKPRHLSFCRSGTLSFSVSPGGTGLEGSERGEGSPAWRKGFPVLKGSPVLQVSGRAQGDA